MTDGMNGVRSDSGNGSNEVEDFLCQPKNPEWDCLLIACQKGNASAVKRILRENPSSASHANVRGQSALHIASWWNHVECVEVLLEFGADVHAVNSLSGATPLHECLQSNRVHRSKEKRRHRIDCLSLLLLEKADPTAVDRLGRVPLDCFALANDDDIADYAEIEECIAANERATKNRVLILVQKLISRELTREEAGKKWLETVVPDLDFQLTYEILSAKVLSMTEAWIDRAENASDEAKEPNQLDNDHYLTCVTWMWGKIFELSRSFQIDANIDNLVLESILRSLSRLVMAIFDRYEHLYKATKSSLKESPSLLQNDATLSSWTELAILLIESRGKIANANEKNSGKDWTKLDNIQQTWTTIARRDYFELAQLWWDRFQISPVDIRNRQGMTVLQFAARSGHFRMVKWLISHSSLSIERSILLRWIESHDDRGHTALAAAIANEHEEIVKLFQDFTTE